jgi:hypothetical protein
MLQYCIVLRNFSLYSWAGVSKSNESGLGLRKRSSCIVAVQKLTRQAYLQEFDIFNCPDQHASFEYLLGNSMHLTHCLPHN